MKKKSKDALKQMKANTQPQPVGHRESSPKREIDGITGLPQEVRKISNKQSNFTLKRTRKRITSKA